MSAHLFVDESKSRGYLLAAAAVLPEDLTLARKHVNALRMPGQRRPHFCKEQNSRRRMIIDSLSSVHAAVTIFEADKRLDERTARSACLERVVDQAAAMGAQMLVMEQDDSILASDRQLLFRLVRTAGLDGKLRYEHKRAREELLLAIPDAVA